MPGRNILVIGGSTGAIQPLRRVLSQLPLDFPAAVFVVLHTATNSPGVLPRILGGSGQLPVAYASDGDRIEEGHVYVAPSDRHLILKKDHMRITRGPRENRFRPAVDPLFRTAAVAHGPAVIGIVLSGGLDDGAVGLAMIKTHGGIAIVQDPVEADAPGMPQTALQQVAVDYIVGTEEMAALIERLVAEPLARSEARMRNPDRTDVSETGADDIHRQKKMGAPSPFTCPECGGALWEYRDGQLLQFHCHIGHRFGGDSLVAAQNEALDHALWAGLRALEESAELRRRMANHARDRKMVSLAEEYDRHADESEARAGLIRRVLMPESNGAVPAAAGAALETNEPE